MLRFSSYTTCFHPETYKGYMHATIFVNILIWDMASNDTIAAVNLTYITLKSVEISTFKEDFLCT